mgnify:CR=1 FL=1
MPGDVSLGMNADKAHRGGITTVAWVMVAHMGALAVAVSVMVRTRGGIRLREQLRALGPPAVGAVAAWLAAEWPWERVHRPGR